MGKNNTSIPKGTRDFGPEEMAKRNYIFDTIKNVYSLYGFQQIETPAIETLNTLLGKYGDEGDKLLFKLLNSGDFLKNISDEELQERNILKLQSKLSKKGLRYDLTVPFARYVVMHRHEIQLPFKRYQIQPVWRADRPQKGRYREFYQCDADIVGSTSLLNEVELINIIDTVFSKLGIRVVIKINNRKILTGIAEIIGYSDKIIEITTAIDKIEKVGIDNVIDELQNSGITDVAIEKLRPLLEFKGSNYAKLEVLSNIFRQSEIGLKGIEESKYILEMLNILNLNNTVELDLTLARGLNYYTGAIFEVKSINTTIGSIAGGGRYDNLTGIFGISGLSGVGISFGADRIYDVLTELDLFPTKKTTDTQVLFINFGQTETEYVLPILNTLRTAGICAEIYPDMVKMKKQMSYANAKKIPFVVLVGDEEMSQNKLTLKSMDTGEQVLFTKEELLKFILSH